MIARIWHGKTKAEMADGYLNVLKSTGIADYRSTEGNLGAYILRRIEDGIAHFFTLTLWDSYDSVRRFAGNDFENAEYFPQESEYLLAYESKAEHFEVIDNFETTPSAKRYLERRKGLPRWW